MKGMIGRMRLWEDWFLKGFDLALVATLSAELATRIDQTNLTNFPARDWATLFTLIGIVLSALVVTGFVSLIVGCVAALLGLYAEAVRRFDSP
jgi:ascorbate-specific PTS system EIIC-type component UlaA